MLRIYVKIISGWAIEYTTSDEGDEYFPNEGLALMQSITPALFEVTSNGSLQSSLWVGRNELIEIKQVSFFDWKALHLSFSVTVKNIGSTTVTDLYCKCHYKVIAMLIILIDR